MSNAGDEVKRIRKGLGLSQSQFAKRFGLNSKTLKSWEQGRRGLDCSTLVYLRVIEQEPEVVARAIQRINK